MQDRSTVWKNLAATGTFLLDSVAVIGDAEYSSTSAPVISHGLFSNAPTVGNCTAASLRFSILTEDEIPKSAEIKIKMRLLDELGGVSSEWLPAGTFYITKRNKDYSSGLITLECYDAMLKAQQDYFQSEDEINPDEWPRPMDEIVMAIAGRMGVPIDPRTVIRTDPQYVVSAPENLTMIDVLGHIGAAHGGNWIITPAGMLRLVPLTTAPDDTTEDALDVVAVLSKLTTGRQLIISGVSMSDDTGLNTYTAGDESGYVLTISANPYASQAICDDLYETYNGLIYNPFTMDKAIYDPAAELGDPVRYNGLVYSVLSKEDATLNTTFRAGIQAPTNEELEDEYPYLSNREKDVNAIKDEINDLITIIADKASIADLYAIYAIINNLSADDIKTGIIRSSDYSVTVVPYLYPAQDLYPASDVYPSNGEQVLTGFAIDFSTGMIYGAFYSAQIDALQNTIDAIEKRLSAIESADYDGQIETLRQTVSGLSTGLSAAQDAITALQQKDEQHDSDISDLQTNVGDLQANQSSMLSDIGTLQSDLTTAQQTLTALSETVAGHATTIGAIQDDLVATHNTIVDMQRSMDDMDETIGNQAEALTALTARVTTLEKASSGQSGTLAEIQQTISDMQSAITALQNSLTYPKS